MSRVEQAVARIEEAKHERVPKPDDKIASQMPEPQGYKLLVTLPDVEKAFTDSKIAKAESTMRLEEVGSVVMFVLAMGPDAYKDKEKFPSGPYCKPGDFVMLRTYSGTRFTVFGKEFRLCNDDQVEAVVQDPRGIVKL
jgi:co-chaperonin GroES (HSP10)